MQEQIINWIQGIVIAGIIISLLEMLLGESSIKKYAKVIFGIFMLFVIISPVISIFSGTNLNSNKIIDEITNYNNEIDTTSNKTYSKINDNNSFTINDIYKNSLKNNIKKGIEGKGYIVTNISIQSTENNNEYTIEKINLTVLNKSNNNESKGESNNINVDSINKIEINNIKLNNGENKDESNSNNTTDLIDKNEQEEIKSYIESYYGISKDKINIC